MPGKTFSSARSQSGFSMIEVLAAVLLLMVGVLGYAALQTRAMQSTGESYFRAQAMGIAQDLASRMRVNAAQKSAYTTASNWSATAPTAPSTTCITAACTAANIATADIQDVRFSALSLLPQGQMLVEACQAATAMTCVYVSWGSTAPTTGSSGQCVDATGKYVVGSSGAGPDCVMLEILI
jgi:type IV pilus assembly protein PilV